MRRLSGTERRLAISFGALFLLFGAAAVLALVGLAEVHASLHQVKSQETRLRAALQLSRAVRDQYAHQAHSILIGDESHVPMYEDARAQVAAHSHHVLEAAQAEYEREWVEEIERAGAAMDDIFRQRLMPAVLAGDTERVRHEHMAVLGIVSGIERRADELARRAEERIEQFDRHASVVQHSTLVWTVALLVGAMLFTGGIGVYIGRSVARPVSVLEAGASRVGRGDLSTRIELATGDEFERLAAQFNRMTSALKEHQDRLVQTEKLAGLGRVAAGVAHEINNPLGVILGYVRLLSKRAEGSLAEDLQIIEDEAVRCQEIVDGLLDLARPIPADREPVPLHSLCADVISRLRSAGFAEVRMELAGAASVPGSEARLRQVVLNLVKNAAEAAGPRGRVNVSIERTGDEVVLAVADSGAGLDEPVQQKLFEPFFTTKASGTGLGLAVSLAIVRAHGGVLEAANAAAGGAIFRVRVPRRPDREDR